MPGLQHFAVILFAFRQIIVQKQAHKSPTQVIRSGKRGADC